MGCKEKLLSSLSLSLSLSLFLYILLLLFLIPESGCGDESSGNDGGHLSREQLHHDGCAGHFSGSRYTLPLQSS